MRKFYHQNNTGDVKGGETLNRLERVCLKNLSLNASNQMKVQAKQVT